MVHKVCTRSYVHVHGAMQLDCATFSYVVHGVRCSQILVCTAMLFHLLLLDVRCILCGARCGYKCLSTHRFIPNREDVSLCKSIPLRALVSLNNSIHEWTITEINSHQFLCRNCSLLANHFRFYNFILNLPLLRRHALRKTPELDKFEKLQRALNSSLLKFSDIFSKNNQIFKEFYIFWYL